MTADTCAPDRRLPAELPITPAAVTGRPWQIVQIRDFPGGATEDQVRAPNGSSGPGAATAPHSHNMYPGSSSRPQVGSPP